MRKIIVAIIAMISIATAAQAQESTMGLMFSMSFSSIANLFTARKGEIDKAKISAFSQRKTDITGKAETEFISFKNETVTSYLPLATWGKDVGYPGLIYNQGDEQFYNIALNASKGDKKSIKKVVGYAAVISIGAIAAIGLSNSSSGKNEPEAEKATQPKTETPTTSTPDTTPDTTSTESTPATTPGESTPTTTPAESTPAESTPDPDEGGTL